MKRLMLFIQESLYKYSFPSKKTNDHRACASSNSTQPLAHSRPLEQPPISLLTEIQPFAACLVKVFSPPYIKSRKCQGKGFVF